MNVHLVNPSTVSFGTAVIAPRWQYVLAGATPRVFGDPILVDETLFQINPARIQPGDVVGIGIHTANALRGYEIGKLARERGAYVTFGGIHATLFSEEARELGGAHAMPHFRRRANLKIEDGQRCRCPGRYRTSTPQPVP